MPAARSSSSPTRLRFRAGLAALAAVAAASAPLALGQGLDGRARPPRNADLKLGKALFVATCGACHTLAAAGTKGRKGPNLGREPSSYGDIVEQVREGGGGMPSFARSFTAAQLADIAAYVVKVSPPGSRGGGSGGGDD